jgi:hypothetical protein
MSLILSGTDGLSDVDGSAATPAIRGTDANTGIFFPAADTIAFAEGGAEVARFDSAGNLGIGTTSPNGRLEVVGSTGASFNAWFRTGDTTAANNAGGGFYNTSSATAASRRATLALDADGANLGGGDYFIIEKSGNSGTADILQYSNAAMRFGTNYTSRATYDMTLSAVGNLGIGTTNPAQKLELRFDTTTAGSEPNILLQNKGASNSTAYSVGGIYGAAFRDVRDPAYIAGIEFYRSSSAGGLASGGSIILYTEGSGGTLPELKGNERMRITPAGQAFFNTTSATFTMPSIGGASFKASPTGGGVPTVEIGNTDTTTDSDGSPALMVFKNSATTSSSARFIQFSVSGAATTMGAIVGAGSGVCAFANFSDISLKKNIQPLSGSLAKIIALKPSSYDMIADESHVNAGLIAQDVKQVYPEYVIENMSDEGKPPLMGITGGLSGGFISELICAIQEQQALIVSMREEIEALKIKVGA